MIEWIVSSSALILMLALLRLLFRKRLSMRVRYALWLAAAVRLLVPVSFFESSISVLNLVKLLGTSGEERSAFDSGGEQQEGDQGGGAEQEQHELPRGVMMGDVEIWADSGGERAGSAGSGTPAEEKDAESGAAGGREAEPGAAAGGGEAGPGAAAGEREAGSEAPGAAEPWKGAEEKASDESNSVKPEPGMSAVLSCIWICGVVICAALTAVVNIDYQKRIYFSRRCYRNCGESRLPVYVSAAVSTPCMFGVFHPAVYLTPDVAEGKALRYILCHENTHYRHRDNLWAVVRMVCLCIHWYNPFVWMAAYLSRQDCELACDEETIRRLGEGERIDYGRVLLEFSVHGSVALGGLRLSTTMSGRKKQLKERLLMIAKKPEKYAGALAAVLLAAPLMLAATFTGSRAEAVHTIGENVDGGCREAVFKSEKESLAGRKKSLKSADRDLEIVGEALPEGVSVAVSQKDGKEYVLQVVSEPMPEAGAYHILRIDLYRGAGAAGEVLQSVCPDKVKPLYTMYQEDSEEQESRISYKMDGKFFFAKPLQNFDDLPLSAVSQFLADDNGPILSASPDGGILAADLNFDGYEDFCVQAGVGSGNIPYYCYLWNPEEERYEHGAMIPNVQVDREAGLIMSPTEDGEGRHSVKYYRFDEENRLHLVRYVEEDSSPEALFPQWDLTYCDWVEYGVEAVDDLDSAVCNGGEINERLVYWAKQALTELYEWSGTKITKAYFTTSIFGDFYFGQSAQDVNASRIFFARCYGARAGFLDCIECMWVATERVVWYSTVTQWNVPEGIQNMTDGQAVEWYFGHLPFTKGEKLTGMEQIYEDTYVIKAESGNYYEIFYNRASREVSSIYGPYDHHPQS